RRSFSLTHQSSSNGLSRSGSGCPVPGRSSNSPRSRAWRICLSIQLSQGTPGGLRSVIAFSLGPAGWWFSGPGARHPGGQLTEDAFQRGVITGYHRQLQVLLDPLARLQGTEVGARDEQKLQLGARELIGCELGDPFRLDRADLRVGGDTHSADAHHLQPLLLEARLDLVVK